MQVSALEQYRENNRIEAKRATGGFPQSVWETYSAFANTMGGVILLGVEERKDHSLHVADLPDPEGLAAEFWRLVNDKTKVSGNILTRSQVAVETVDGKKIVVVTVPRASRQEKPVYIGGNPFGGSYRRSGEGDYRCSVEEVESMLRDKSHQTQDMRLLGEITASALCDESLQAYRKRVASARPASVWTAYTDEEFFTQAGAVQLDGDGALHPTAAGLLFFGRRAEIARVFPVLALRCLEKGETVFVGENLYEFYFAVKAKLGRYPAPIKKALLEGLANCLSNADYFGGGEITAEIEENGVLFRNPGGFRIDLVRAKNGGVADPRNAGLVKLFHLMEIGTGLGSGLPRIYAVWREQGFLPPTIVEEFSPDYITLRLPLVKGEQTVGVLREDLQREGWLNYLTARAFVTEREASAVFGLAALKGLVEDGLVVEESSLEGTRYRLKR